MILLYQAFSIVLSPLIDIYLWTRKLSKKENRDRFGERLGIPSLGRPRGFLLMIHCASVGESNSALPFVEFMQEKYPQITILFTSGTASSAIEMSKKLPSQVIHQFVPVDKFLTVRKFLKHWQPNLAIFFESEIWPNLVNETRKNGCELILMNARISQKSYQRWLFLHKIGFNILQNFSLCFAQSKKDATYFKNLGVKKVLFLGNLKSLAGNSKIDPAAFSALQNSLTNRSVWLAASTHKNEEEFVIATHQKLKNLIPNLLTIIAPRHIQRASDIIHLIKKPDLPYRQRSKNELPDNLCDIYLADTMGELLLLYNSVKFAFIGGSLLDNIGGHTPYEALRVGCFPISGPYVSNFIEAYADLQEAGQAQLVKNGEELTQIVKSFFLNPEKLPVIKFNNNNEEPELLSKISAELSLYIKNNQGKSK